MPKSLAANEPEERKNSSFTSISIQFAANFNCLLKQHLLGI